MFGGSSYGNFLRTYLIIFGGIFLVVGVVVILTLGGIPFAGAGMVLMGSIFALVGGGIVVAGLMVGRGNSADPQTFATGLPGTATITGVTQTGTSVNDQPEIKMGLLVQLPGQVAYATEHTEIVPLILLARAQPGATLPVRVDPAEPQKVVIDWSGRSAMPAMGGAPPASAEPGSGMDESLAQAQAALTASGAAGVPNMFATPDQANYSVEQLRAYLRANGIAAQAHVDFLEDTGKIVGDERLYTMEMTLMMPGSAPEKLERSAAMVPIGAMSRLRQGMTVPVKVAAENHHLLTVEWDKV